MEYKNTKTIFARKIVKMKIEDRKLNIRIGSQLYNARTELNLSQADLEKEGVISQSNLSKIENAQLSVSAATLYKLAKRYGKELNYFFE